VAYNHNQNDDKAGKGGICMFISLKIKHLIHNKGTVGANLAQWVRFSGIPNGDVAILNVYAPNGARKIIDLQQALCRMLSTNSQWIAVGDWNIVEDARDKSTEGGRLLGGQERVEFELFKSHFHVMDFFKYEHNLKHSWDNRRGEGMRVLAHLNRVYTFFS
jgi:exonuclease III